MKNILICFFIYGLLFLTLSPLQAQDYQNIFQKGIIQEEAEGNLTKAIEIYNSLVNDVDVARRLRAKSLLRVGICYEKSGNKNARKTYQKLISEYTDQPEIVALGKEQLKGLKKVKQPKKNGGIIATQIKSPEGEGGRISSDGQSLIYVDWTTKDDKPAINIKDLRTGKTRIVSKVGTWEAPIKFPDNPIWAPDEKQFTYFWYDKMEGKSEFHIANTDGTNDEVIAKGKDALYPIAWSPDGIYILGVTEKNEGHKELVLFSIKDKSSKILKRGKKNGSGANFSPDSKYIVYAMQQAENSNENDIYLMSIDGSIDKKIISNAANDTNPQWSTEGKHLVFLSDRHGTNDLWKIRIENGSTVGTAKLVKSNLGSITAIMGVAKDQSLYYETRSSRKDIYLLNIDLTGKTTINAPTRISDLKVKSNTNPAISKDGRYIAFVRWQLIKDPNISGRPFFISIYDTKTGEIKNSTSKTYKLNQLNMYGPNLQWSPKGDKILLLGRRIDKENLIAGIFIYDVKTEDFQSIIEIPDYKGFTEIPSIGTGHIFSNEGKSIYYLSTDGKNIHRVELRTKKETVVYTIADTMGGFLFSNDESKLVYDLDEIYNELYTTNMLSGETKKIVSLENDNMALLIGWDPNDADIYYANALSWVPNSIMRISAEGGIPKKLINLNLKDVFPNGTVNDGAIDQSFKTMAIELAVEHVEMWKLEGVFDD